METPAQKIANMLKEQYAKFLKSPLVIPVGVAIGVCAYVLVVIFLSGFCLGGLITPAIILGVFWKFGIKDVKKLLLVGALTCLVGGFVLGAYLPYSWLELDDPLTESDDGKFTDGTVTPARGDATTAFNFTITIHWDNLSEAQNVHLIVAGVGYFTHPDMNLTMTALPAADPNSTAIEYYIETEVQDPMNAFYFGAPINGKWVYIGALGPSTAELGSLIAWILPTTILSTFGSVYPIFALLLVMVWWTRRARRLRTEAWERAVAEREKEREGVGREETKVPSLSKAMGLEGDEGFVCSECGADVPGDAKVCPKCGEKFD